jgi:YVTN family beta-propeller protein
MLGRAMAPAFRILGPLEVRIDDRPVALGGGRERAILGILLLNVGAVVSVERLIDGVWGDARPSSAKHMVHEYVSRLRQSLADAGVIATRPPGYVLELADGVLDVSQFVRLTAAARVAAGARREGEALRSYDQALAVWRGDALSDVAMESHAQIAVERLDRERGLVREERIDCALALGQHLQLIPELEHRVEEAPLRERSRAQLMLALYRAGRQTDALDRYREGRQLLVDQAGVEPGHELRQLEHAILSHDPALALAPVRPEPERPPGPATAPLRGRRMQALILGALLVATVGIVVLVVARSGSEALAQVDPNSAGAIDPGRDRLVDQVRVGSGPGRIAAGFGSLWVVNDFDGTVSRIDPSTGTVDQTITVGGDPTGIAVGAGFVWVACTDTRSVDRIDPRLNRRVQRITVGNGPSGIAISPGAVWVTNRLDDTVTEIESTTGTVRRTLDAGPGPSDIAYGLGALWIANESSSTVTHLDPETGALSEVTVGNGPEAVAVGYGSIWVASTLDGTVSRIDPTSDTITSTIAVGLGPSSILASAGAIWVADSYASRIVRIDPAANHIVRTIDVGSGPQGLASIDGRVWLSARENAAIHRGGTLRLFNLYPPDSLDQGAGYVASAWSVFSVTGDGLVGFKRVGGLDGGTLVPDLASSLPTPTDGGRTYTFQLRPGIRYSNGDPVRASDVRRALERAFRLNSPGAPFFAGIVGAGACSKRRCDLSRGVVTDDRAGTVIVHLRQPDPEILYKLAVPFADPVPTEVSLTRAAPLGVPGTGPYVIQSYKNTHLVLVRNPRFREWSAAAQPDGYPDRIILTYNDALGAQLTAVELGKADVMESPVPPSRVHEVETRYAAQVHVFPFSQTIAVFLNTRVPPFDNLAARQAFNFAIDRGKVVAEFGGAEAATVTCQILPAGMPGYRPYCPYTRNPTPHGVWTSPDLARARKLVAASGTRGEKVVIWTRADKPFQLDIGHLAVAALDRLGYRSSLKTVKGYAYFGEIADSRNAVQAGFYAWSQDYPAASNFLTLFTCGMFEPDSDSNENDSEICNPRIDRAVGRALTEQTRDAGAPSNATWAAVDRLVTDTAPWVPVANTRDSVLVSRRVGNVQANTQWGVLIDQLWVR